MDFFAWVGRFDADDTSGAAALSGEPGSGDTGEAVDGLVTDEFDLVVGLAVAVLMTMVVFGFPQYARIIHGGQQKTVQKSTVCENMFI